MGIIYDFDGTLTPYSLPQYKIIKECGFDDTKYMNSVKQLMNTHKLSMYVAYFQTYITILQNNNKKFNIENICLGASNVQFNKGVFEYFFDLQYAKTNIKHYVLTSGFEDYVKFTSISPYLNGVFGTTLKVTDSKNLEIDSLMSDKYKVEIIKEIQKSNNISGSDIVYFGDGLTDQYAFEFVHSIGGKSIFVCDNISENSSYKTLKNLRIIDYCFENDFSKTSNIYKFVKSLNKN